MQRVAVWDLAEIVRELYVDSNEHLPTKDVNDHPSNKVIGGVRKIRIVTSCIKQDLVIVS